MRWRVGIVGEVVFIGGRGWVRGEKVNLQRLVGPTDATEGRSGVGFGHTTVADEGSFGKGLLVPFCVIGGFVGQELPALWNARRRSEQVLYALLLYF